jgi:preprotein translocase subunit SecA
MLDLINKTLGKFFGTKTDRDLKELTPFVGAINNEFASLSTLSNDELRNFTITFKNTITERIAETDASIAQLQTDAEQNTDLDAAAKEDIYQSIDKLKKQRLQIIEEVLNEIHPQAFAVVKEAAKRLTQNEQLEVTATPHDKHLATYRKNVVINGDKAYYANQWLAAGNTVSWDMVHYDVQLIGGTVLHQGKIAEMSTGEGKTLVATLPIYLNALAGCGVHVVTVNDYLAKRDSEWNGPLFEFLNLTVDCIDKHQPNSDNRRKAYLADITYGTNNEFGFDYLRDNMARSPEDMVQRQHHFAIVDEVDSVLIDDARTPLIISGPTPRGDDQMFHALKPNVEILINAQRNYLNTAIADAKKKFGDKNNDEAGLPLLRAFRGLPKSKALIKFLSEDGVRVLLQKTENFYMQDQSKEMHKVDAELYFVIDEKSNQVELTEKGIELISANTDKDFFIVPDMGSFIADLDKLGLSDIEKLEKKDALMRDFSVKSERIHTITQLLKAYTLFERDTEYIISDDGKVKIVDEQTGRVLEGRRYSDGLHQAIEAKENVKIEAATQTYATVTLQNYFRMYHKLAGMTGTAETEAGELWEIYKLDVVTIPTNRPVIRKDHEDQVYRTTREKYKAVIDEITKLTQAGRPVLVGTTSVEISELLSRTLRANNIKHNVLNAKQHQREAEIVAEAGKAGTVTIATNMAGRGTDIKLGPGVREAGGLAIIGTERHESRRVDRQLRGRSGRQGDPGSSQFFVSLEDNLMRLFGSERIAKLMVRMGLEDGEVIQHSMITKSIERAQKKVEENHFGTRKRLLEYDDVMNAQREVIYKKRRHALYGERLQLDMLNMQYDLADVLIKNAHDAADYNQLSLDSIRYFGMECPITNDTFLGTKNTDSIAEKMFDAAHQHYRNKSIAIAKHTYPIIQNVFQQQGQTIENIVVPFSDGLRQMQVMVNLKKAYDTQGAELIAALERNITLAVIDDEWKEHLRAMDDLKQSVQNAVYEQKDPLLIYKFESFKLFQQVLEDINKDILSFVFKGFIPMENPEQVREAKPLPKPDTSKLKATHADADAPPAATAANRNVSSTQAPRYANDEAPKPKQQPMRAEQKVGRNDACPCGSGKKFKNCHGQMQD